MKWHLATGFVSFLTCWDSIYTSARMNQVSATIKEGSPVLVWAWNFFCLFWYRTTTLVKQSSVDPIALQNLPLIIVDVLVGTTKIPYTLRKSYLSFSRLKNALKKSSSVATPHPCITAKNCNYNHKHRGHVKINYLFVCYLLLHHICSNIYLWQSMLISSIFKLIAGIYQKCPIML